MALVETVWDKTLISAPGLYRDVPMADYHGQLTVTPSISSSGQRTIWSTSPAHYFDGSYLDPTPPEPVERPYFSVGRAAHHLLLLGRKGFDAEFVIRPSRFPDYRTDDAKRWKRETIKAGLTIITPAELDDIVGMAKSLGADPLVRAGILDGLVERTLVYRDPETGIWVKSRPDAIPMDEDAADLKTCVSVSDDAIERSITSFGYNQQGATVRSALLHGQGVVMRDFSLVWVEKKRPWCVRVVPVTPEDLDRGADQNRVANWAFAHGVKTGEWPGPGHDSEAKYMGLSPWAKKRIDERLALLLPDIEGAKYAASALRQQQVEPDGSDDQEEDQ
jgi:PDDEXK-like domain of unknown function (DUF3799)